jgi:hypothetical protein
MTTLVGQAALVDVEGELCVERLDEEFIALAREHLEARLARRLHEQTRGFPRYRQDEAGTQLVGADVALKLLLVRFSSAKPDERLGITEAGVGTGRRDRVLPECGRASSRPQLSPVT